MNNQLTNIVDEIERLPDVHFYGRVSSIKGLLVECSGLEKVVSVGSRCIIHARSGGKITCEVIGFKNNRVLLMPFGNLEGVGMGCKVIMMDEESVIFPADNWRGRVINAMAEPIDGKGPLASGSHSYPFRNTPPPAHSRGRVKDKID